MSPPLSNPIVFYDIAFKAPRESTNSAPNPWKSRLALNFKDLPYNTTWVPLPDVPKVRQHMNLSACRNFADGSDFYTLPIITDPKTGATVGDSFDIAVYLQRTYPSSGAGDLFPRQKLDYVFTPEQPLAVPLSKIDSAGYDEYARFNINVDTLFTTYVVLMAGGMSLEPAGEEVFVKRASTDSFDVIKLACTGAQRATTLSAFQRDSKSLAQLFQRDPGGPFLLGAQASYADLIVGGWLRMAWRTLPHAEWADLCGWHDGIFGQLHKALDRYSRVDVGCELHDQHI